MAYLKQCDVCKNIIKDHVYVIQIFKRDLPNSWFNDKPRKEIEICQECLSQGFMIIYKKFRDYKDV